MEKNTTPNRSTQKSITKYLARPEGNIAYDVSGSGPLVVLVPGMCDLRSSYRFLAPALVEAGYTVVTTDLRGQGESDTTFSSYGDSETADDVIALITSLRGPATIVGNSLGAAVAVLVAARRPELVSGIALLGPFVRNPANANRLMVGIQHLLTARPWLATVWKAYLPSLYAGAKPADFDDYRASVIAAMRRPGYARTYSLTTRASHDEPEQNLTLVTAPTLVIMGDRDPDFTDPTAEANWIGSTLNGRVVMVEECGHYPQSQQPEATTSAITDFLGSLTHNA
jgi:pimeloyl-ACP methyl ester carboxylesterase